MNGALLIGTGRVILLALALASTRLSTEMLTQAEVGRLSVIAGLASIGSILVDRSLGAYWYRMVLPWNAGGRARRAFATFVAFASIAALVAAAIGVATNAIFHVVEGIDRGWLACILLLGVAGNCTFLASVGALNLLGHRSLFVACSLGSALIGLLLATELAHYAPRAEVWLLGVLLGQGAVLLASVWLLMRRLGRTPRAAAEHSNAREWCAFALPTLATALLYGVQLLGYRFVLNAIGGPEGLAPYAVAFGLGVAAMNAFDYFLTQLVQPRLLRGTLSGESGDAARAWSEYASAVVPAVILSVTFIATLAPVMLRVGAASRFAAASNLVVWGGVVDGLRMLAQTFGLIAHLTLTPRRLIAPTILGTVTALGGGMLLHRVRPGDGMAIGMALGGAVWLVAIARTVLPTLPVRLPMGRTAAAVVGGVALVGVSHLLPSQERTTSMPMALGSAAGIGLAFVTMQWLFARGWIVGIDRDDSVTAAPVGSAPAA